MSNECKHGMSYVVEESVMTPNQIAAAFVGKARISCLGGLGRQLSDSLDRSLSTVPQSGLLAAGEILQLLEQECVTADDSAIIEKALDDLAGRIAPSEECDDNG